jgi:Protein of unknown function/AsmA-like C-terminal region
LRAFVGLCGVFGGLALVGLLALAVVLAHGPISLESLAPAIARSLEQRFDNQFAFSIGPTSIGRSEYGLGLIFEGMEIKDQSGHTLVSAPAGHVGLDFLSLLTFAIKVKRLEIDKIDLRLTVQPNGALSLAAAKSPDAVAFDLAPPTPGGRAAPSVAMLAELIEAVTGKAQPLDYLAIGEGRLEIADQKSGRTAAFENVGVTFDKGDRLAGLRIVATGPSGPWSLAAQALGGDAKTLTLEAHDMSLADVLLVSGRTAPFEADMPISFKLNLQLSADQTISDMKGRVSLGAGYFKLDDPEHEPFLIDEAYGDIRLDRDGGRILAENFQLFAGHTHAALTGFVMPPAPGDQIWSANFSADGAVIGGERPGEQPLVLDKVNFQARYFDRDQRFAVDNFSVSGAGANASLSGEIAATPSGPTAKVKLDVAHTLGLNLLRMWPSFIVADVRFWCIQHLRGGEIQTASLVLDWDAAAFTAARQKRAVPADSVHTEFSLKDAAVDLLPGVPPLSGLDATGVLTGSTITITAKRGNVDMAPGRRIAASDLSFVIPDTTPRALIAAQAGAHLQGPADGLADLLGREALKSFVGLSVDPAATKGQFDGKVAIDLKLGKTARPDDIFFHASGALSNLQIDKFLATERFEQGELTFSGDRSGIRISGDGRIGGAATSVEIHKGAAEEGSVDLALTIDDAFRAKHGLDFGPTISGPMNVQVNAPLSRKGANIDVDLTRVALDNPVPGLIKLAGKPGKATFTVKADAEGLAIGAIDIEAGAASIKGAAQLSSDGGLVSAKFTQVRLSPGDDMKVDIAATDALLKVTAHGATIDARPLVKAAIDRKPTGSLGRDIDLDFKVASAIGANKRTMTQVEVSSSRRGGELQHVKARAHLGSSNVTLTRDGGTTRIATGDAGALVKFFDLYSHLEGGTLDLVMHDVADGQAGAANVKDFVLRNEPAVRQLVAAGQAPDKKQGADAAPVDPDAAPFDKMTAEFVRTTGRIDLREAVIYNRQMGLTTQGFLDYGHDRIDLNGTFVPAYQVNSAVTHIPVLGALLGGGTHEGLFGVNYRIVGPASAPVLNVNPLSAMAPGFLRKIFGAIDGTSPPLQNIPAAQAQ